MGRSGGYLGGGLVVNIGGGFTGWNTPSSRPDAGLGKIGSRRHKAKNRLSAQERAFLHALARATVLSLPLPRTPESLVKSISKFKDPISWALGDYKRRSSFENYKKNIKSDIWKGNFTEKTNYLYNKILLENKFIRDFCFAVYSSKPIPTPPPSIAKEIARFSGPFEWIEEKKRRRIIYQAAFQEWRNENG